jgi:hypothetical protein
MVFPSASPKHLDGAMLNDDAPCSPFYDVGLRAVPLLLLRSPSGRSRACRPGPPFPREHHAHAADIVIGLAVQPPDRAAPMKPTRSIAHSSSGPLRQREIRGAIRDPPGGLTEVLPAGLGEPDYAVRYATRTAW